MEWVESELSQISLGDVRLNTRAKKLMLSISKNISASIPMNCENWYTAKAAYRFFSNKKVTFEKILFPHVSSTLDRIKEEEVILLPQDTTELNYSSQPFRKFDVNPGYHDTDKIYYIHPLLAFTENRLCLGIIDVNSWTRETLNRNLKSKTEARNELTHKPIEEKESFRWLLGYRKGCYVAEKCPNTQCVVIGDRESDIYDIFHEKEHGENIKKAEWLIRVMHNRAILNSFGQRDQEKLYSKLKLTPILAKVEFDMPKQGKRKARHVSQSIQVQQVQLYPPTGRRGDQRLKPVTVTVLQATEINPPNDEKPINWCLMSSILFNDPKEATKLLKWYLARWEIEVYFKLLKSGCNLEKIQLTGEARYKPCIIMYMIIAWRILFITMVNRTNPEISCEFCYSDKEWKMIYCLSKKQHPPLDPPSSMEITRLLAQLGGYTNRNSDSLPGIKTIWLGLSRLYQSLATIEAMQLMGND